MVVFLKITFLSISEIKIPELVVLTLPFQIFSLYYQIILINGFSIYHSHIYCVLTSIFFLFVLSITYAFSFHFVSSLQFLDQN